MKLKSATSIKGGREYMEDSASFLDLNGITIATVCDGHGGDSLSRRCSKELPGIFYNSIINLKDPKEKAVALRKVTIEFGNNTKRTKSGTTLTTTIDDGAVIYIINVGDSRTSIHLKPDGIVYHLKSLFSKNNICESQILYYITPFFTTVDHDASLEDEKIRIADSGGILNGDRLNGILNVTRTFGDHGVGEGLCHVPDIFWINKKDITGPILMYTDGIYEPVKDDKSLETKHLIYHMAEKWGSDALVSHVVEKGSGDNITVLILEL